MDEAADQSSSSEEVFKPLENYRVGRNEIVAGTVAPSYINPLHGLQRLEKIMDEYVGGYSMFYVTSEHLLNRGLELLDDAEGGSSSTSAPRTCTSCSGHGSSSTGS